MENYITIVLIGVIISIGFLSYKVWEELETKKDFCSEK
ncbi:hypothetical protein FEM21_22870 [Flavobacterium seoulense]|uniref:Uncharacterized protein n=1 Tax=Flavobacterium seoulense TaxID=1492738 RepID=A0A066WUC2_9FLAO|nr:hypothetical protein FEM21_22870 [Flavobacterium seoulense]